MMPCRLPSLAAFAGLILVSVPAGATDLLAHRALYDLKLDANKHGDLQGAVGTMAYEVLDTCDGWASRQRLKMTITNSEGQDIEALLAAAEAGKKFITVPLFDGTTDKGAQDSSVAITSWGGPKPTAWPDLSRLDSGKVHLAFFDRDIAAQQPDYEVSMRYWANGVADDLAMDFGDFTMDGKLTEFTPVKPHC
jgi:hypothetical protein